MLNKAEFEELVLDLKSAACNLSSASVHHLRVPTDPQIAKDNYEHATNAIMAAFSSIQEEHAEMREILKKYADAGLTDALHFIHPPRW